MNNKKVILIGVLVLTLGILILINLHKLILFLNNEQNRFNSIQIVNAEHLDVNRNFVEKIYDSIKSKDNIWSNEINDGEYVRVTFEKNLTSVDDITIYPIVTNGNPIIEVYEKDKDKVIASFRDITSDSYNKIFLRDLIKSQDQFDLRVINGSIKFDHIIDPTVTEVFSDSFEDGISWTHWTEVSGTGWSNVNLCPTNCADGAQCACAENGAINALQLTNSLDLTPYSECILTYSRYVDSSFDNGEFYYVNVTNSGGNFVNIFSCTNGQACEDNTWDTETYNITSGVGLNNNFKIRVTASKNDLNEEAGFDFVNVTCMTSDANAPLVTINSPENNAEYSRLLDLPLSFNISLNENGVANYTLDNGLTNISMSSEDGLNFNASSGDLDFGDYTFQVYAQDVNGNANYTSNVSFSVVQQYALVNGTVLDSNGNPINAKVTIYDEVANSFVYNETGDNLTAIIPINSTYTIRVFPLDIDYVDRIRFDNINLTEQNITDTSLEVARLDSVSSLDNLFSVFSVDPLLDNFTNYTVFFTAQSSELKNCPSWNFTDQSCSSGWEPFLHDLTPGQEYNITLPSGNSAFGFVELTKALHLDENRTIISNIFDSVRQIDGIWSETISDTHYVRIAFNKNLTSSNDITIYPRTISGTPMITVYEEDGTNQIVNFTSITDNQYNTVFLTNLGSRSQSVFDLLISGGDLQFDNIVDPLVSETLVPNAVSQRASNGTHTDTGGFAIQRTSLLTSSGINGLNTSNNIAFRPRGESASLDTFVFVNFTVPSNEAITRIFLTVRSNTTVANHMKGMALWNFTSGGWRRVNFSAGAIGVLNTTTYNLSVSEMDHFVSNSKFRLMAYQNSTATGGFGVDFMSADVVYEQNIPPVTNLNAPSNGTTVTDPVVSFNATFSDNFALHNTTLYVWNSTGDIINTTDATIVGLADSTNITVTLPYSGTYVWNYLTFDNASNRAMNSTNFTVIYNDITPPQVTINNPANDTLNPPILFNVTLNKDGSACNFTLTNGKLNYTMQNNGNRDFNATNSTISDGSYVAKYFCWDSSNNLNSTTNITFSALNLVNTYSINLTGILRINGSNYRIGDLFKNSNLEILLNSQFGKFRGLFKTNSDSLTLGESNTRFGGLFRINTQRLTIDNAVTRLLGLFRINSQTIAVDNANTRYSGIFRVNQDSLGFSLGISRTYGANRIASNSIGLSDSVNRFLGIFRINNNNIGITESNTRFGGLFRINNQEFVFGENANKFSGLFRINQQTISLDENSYRLLGLFRIQLQVINVNEVLINVQNILKYLVELVQQLNLNNSVERLAGIFKIPTNLLSIDAVSNRNYIGLRANIQDMSLNSIANRIAGIFRINNNNIGITESNTRFGGLFRIMGQQLNLVNSNSRFSGLFRINSQTLTIDDTNTRFSGLFRLNTQRLTIDNSLTRLASLFRINQQGINVNEKNTRFSGLFKVNAQTLTLDNAVTRLLGLFRINSQTIAVDNSNSKYSGIFRVNQDSLGFSLGISRTYGANRIASNSIGLSDSVNRFLGMFRTPTQVVNVRAGTNLGAEILKYVIQLIERINLNETINRLANLIRTSSINVNVAESNTRFSGLFRINTQRLTIDNAVNRLAYMFRSTDDSFTLDLGFRGNLGANRINSQIVGLNLASERIGNIFRLPTNLISFNFNLERFFGANREISNEISLEDYASRFSGIFRISSTNIGLSDSLYKQASRVRVAIQDISITNSVTRFGRIFRLQTQQIVLQSIASRVGGLTQYLVELVQRLSLTNSTQRNSHILKGFSDLMRLFFGLFSDKNLPTGSGNGGNGGSNGNGGSGGGSGGSSFGSDNSFGRIIRGTNREIFSSNRKSFSIGNGQIHHITFNGYDGSKAIFTMESTPEVFTLDIVDSKNFDFNKDGLDDLSVKLNSINSLRNSATIELTPLLGAERLKEVLFSPQNMKVSLKQGQTSTRDLVIENTGNRNIALNLEVSGLKDQLKLSETEITLEPGMSKTVKVDFIVREDAAPELYIGKIVAKAPGFEDEVLVAIDASSKGALFDINTEILDGRIISPGGKILASVQILNLGDIGEVDVVVYYSIEDTSTGQIYDIEHETVAVSTQTSLLKTINVPKELTRGVYLLNVKAVYPSRENDNEESIVNASTWFSIISYKTYAVYALIILILVAGIVYVVMYLKRNGFFFSRSGYYMRNIQNFKRANFK